MEFLVISDNKLKIMLDKAEMKKFGLDRADIDYSEAEVRCAFWDILDIAAKECGFKAKGEKVLIQFYPSKSGGEIFITKLGLLSKSTERSLSASQRITMLSSEIKIYKFENLSAISAALRVSASRLPEKIKVFSGEGGEYYLIFEERNTKAASVMSEFGVEIPSKLEAYIAERTVKISSPYKTLATEAFGEN